MVCYADDAAIFAETEDDLQRPTSTENQINKASAMSRCLRQIIWANEYMRKESKVRIYKTCIRPIMTYGIETREETNKTKRTNERRKQE